MLITVYNRPRVIPCLLIKDEGIVKTVRFSAPNYLGDVINAVKIFNEKEVDELCLLDITASKQNKEPDYLLLKNIASEAFMPLSYGGGINNIEQAKKLYHIGYEKIIINTGFVKTPKLVEEIARYAGSQSVVVSIDVKRNLFGDYFCYTVDGSHKTEYSPQELAIQAEAWSGGNLFKFHR